MRNPDAAADVIILTIKAAHAPLLERQARAEADTAALRAQVATLVAELATLRDRLVTMEAKALVPGPRGAAGKDGRDGRDGRDAPTLTTPATTSDDLLITDRTN